MSGLGVNVKQNGAPARCQRADAIWKSRVCLCQPRGRGRAIAYRVFICVTYQRVVPANAGTHTPRTLVSALEQRPFLTFEARGDGSLRSQGRPAERSCEAATVATHG